MHSSEISSKSFALDNIQSRIGRVFFGFFLFYLITGNFFRFIELTFMPQGLLFSEIILYGLGVVYFLANPVLTRQMVLGLCIAFLIVLSTCYGVFIHGWDLLSVMYGPRTCMMILCGILLGQVAFEQFRGNTEALLKKLVHAYAIVCLGGFVIMGLFPSSARFWALLEHFGIIFHGDPHISRFVSPYFDPNFFAWRGG
jgi:hypothetical protein